MERISIRRTFNIGNFESLSVEATAEADNIEHARLLASKQVLELAQQELVRIFNIRHHNINSSPWDQVLMELAGVKKELGL